MVSVNFNAMGREKTKEEGSVKGFFWIFKNLSSMILLFPQTVWKCT